MMHIFIFNNASRAANYGIGTSLCFWAANIYIRYRGDWKLCN